MTAVAWTGQKIWKVTSGLLWDIFRWQDAQKDQPNADEIKELVYKPLTCVDVLTPYSEVGVVQGNWKDSKAYVDRVKGEADTTAFERHVQSRTVRADEVWPLQRPASYFDMLLTDLQVDYKST